jgi:hypothetical protein
LLRSLWFHYASRGHADWRKDRNCRAKNAKMLVKKSGFLNIWLIKVSSLSFLLSENNQKIDKKMKKKIHKSPKQSKTSTSLSLHASRPHAQIRNPLFAQEMPRPYLNHALEIIKKEKEKKSFLM